jgi:hypothetical protein
MAQQTDQSEAWGDTRRLPAGLTLKRPVSLDDLKTDTEYDPQGAEEFVGARQEFCVNGCSFPCAAGILGGGKVGILVLDFHFSTAHSFSCFWCSYFIIN